MSPSENTETELRRLLRSILELDARHEEGDATNENAAGEVEHSEAQPFEPVRLPELIPSSPSGVVLVPSKVSRGRVVLRDLWRRLGQPQKLWVWLPHRERYLILSTRQPRDEQGLMLSMAGRVKQVHVESTSSIRVRIPANMLRRLGVREGQYVMLADDQSASRDQAQELCLWNPAAAPELKAWMNASGHDSPRE